MENLGLEAVDLKLPPEWGISPQASGPYPALRFMPHVTRGEGLFAAVMRKPGAAPAGKNTGSIPTESFPEAVDGRNSAYRNTAPEAGR